MIKIVGIGPGGKDYILPIAKKEIESAKILVGGRRALADFAQNSQKTFPITGDIGKVLNFIKKTPEDVVVMVSGDPGYYSLLDTIRKNFSDDEIVVIPGLSSIQVAFARLNLPWHDAKLLSFHGRAPKKEDLVFDKDKALGILTDGIYNSQKIAEILIDAGWDKNANISIFERLSYKDEKITKMTLKKAKNSEPISHGVVVIY